ncbi:MAG: hypothetical protein NT053_08455 [Cyanobacteria bacterium]|nr:hypothetical protein [Cyanobacteriota bacterium]
MDADPSAHIQVERLGGLAGFGGSHSHLRSRGTLKLDALSPDDRQAIDGLFQAPPIPKALSLKRDAFRYRITRETPTGSESIEVPEQMVPESLRSSVRDELI